MREAILEPDLPIIDPHHHLWDRPTEILKNLPPSDHGFMDIIRETPRYLLDELLADLQSGHNIRATVYMECGAMSMPLPMFPFRAISINGSMVGSLGETQEMMELVRAGKIDPVPVTKRPLSAANDTLNDLREGKIVGRVVLTP